MRVHSAHQCHEAVRNGKAHSNAPPLSKRIVQSGRPSQPSCLHAICLWSMDKPRRAALHCLAARTLGCPAPTNQRKSRGLCRARPRETCTPACRPTCSQQRCGTSALAPARRGGWMDAREGRWAHTNEKRRWPRVSFTDRSKSARRRCPVRGNPTVWPAVKRRCVRWDARRFQATRRYSCGRVAMGSGGTLLRTVSESPSGRIGVH